MPSQRVRMKTSKFRYRHPPFFVGCCASNRLPPLLPIFLHFFLLFCFFGLSTTKGFPSASAATAAIAGGSGVQQQYFRLKPVDTEVVEGDVAELSCQIGHQSGAVQWSKDGFLLGFQASIPGYVRYAMIMEPEKGIYNLRIHNAQLDDEAEYQCQVGPAPKHQSIRALARLHVIVPPKTVTMSGTRTESISQLKNTYSVEGKEGEKVVLACSASQSKPPPTVKWFRKHIELLPEASRTYYNKTAVNNKYVLFTTESSIALYPKVDEQYACELQHPGLLKPLRATAQLNILSAPGPPLIEGFKEGDIVAVGEPLTLTCSSRSGYPPPKVIWYRNGLEVDRSYVAGPRNEAINAFTFNVRVEDNQAVYRCSSTNSQTSKPLEAAIRLNVLFLPAKVSVSGPSEARLFQTISVVCTTRPANPPPRISWIVDGNVSSSGVLETRSDGASAWVVTSTLTTTITRQEPKSKSFTCSAESSALKETVNATHKVSVIYAPSEPSLLGYKAGTAVLAGSLQKFKCVSLNGNPRASLKWFKEEREISAITSVTGSGVSSELVIRPEPADNGATYRCQATSPALSEPLQAAFKLSVHYPPVKVSIRAEPLLIKANETVRVECLAGPSSPAATIEWRKNGRAVIDASSEQLATEPATKPGDGSRPPAGEMSLSWFTLNASSADDGSVITCLARNPVIEGSLARDDLALSVLYKPEFESTETHLVLAEGDNKLVNLSLKANPRVEAFEWRRVPASTVGDGQGSTGSSGGLQAEPFLELPYRSVRANGTLLYIWNISRNESGKYVALASNKMGSSTAFLFIDVVYSATIEEPINVIASSRKRGLPPKEGDSYMELLCRIRANPPAKVLWRKQGKEHNIDWFRAKLREEKSLSSSEGQQTFVLTIFNVSRHDSGLFTCTASNGVGSLSATSSMLVNVASRPDIDRFGPSKVAVALQDTRARLVCTARGFPAANFSWSFLDESAPPTKYAVTTRLESSPLSDLVASELVVEDLTTSDLRKYGCSASSTPEPPGKPRLINVTQDSALLAWEPAYDGGLEQSFRTRYHRVPGHHEQDQNEEDQEHQEPLEYSYAFASSGSQTLTVTGLQPDTEYLFALIASNQLGESLPSPRVKAHTKPLEKKTRGASDLVYAPPGESRRLDPSGLMGENGSFIILACLVASLLASSTASAFVVVACYRRRQRTKRSSAQTPSVQTHSGGSGTMDSRSPGDDEDDQEDNLSPPPPFLISEGGLALGYCECELSTELHHHQSQHAQHHQQHQQHLHSVIPTGIEFAQSTTDGSHGIGLGKCLCVGDYSDFATKLMSPIGHQQPDILMNQIKQEPECINHSGLLYAGGTPFKLMPASEGDLDDGGFAFGGSHSAGSGGPTSMAPHRTSTGTIGGCGGRVSILGPEQQQQLLLLPSSQADFLVHPPLSTLLEEVEEMV